MPSRQPPVPPPLFPATTPPSQTNHHHHHIRIIIPILAGTIALSLLAFTVILLLRKLSRHRSATAPSDNLLKAPHRFSYSVLRRATSSFSASNRLGQGGFGSVYKAALPSGEEAAVKVMDVGSLQGEREFNNELSLASKIDSNYVVSVLGFSSDDNKKRRRMVLVYELMANGSLQDALLSRKCAELMQWKARFSIAIDIANGLMYLHNQCDPPVIHGDIKPSNVLLDSGFKAKIADFGLARLKIEGEDDCYLEVAEEEDKGISLATKKKKKMMKKKEIAEDNGSIIEEEEEEETESVVTTGFEIGGGVDLSPESCVVRALDSEASPEVGLVEASPSEGLDKTSVSDACFDRLSMDSGKDLISGGRKVSRKKSGSGRDWWWKQDNGGGSESGRVKDYVMEWIGSEIKKERPKTEWIGSQGSLENSGSSTKTDSKRHKKRLEWWASLDEEKIRRKEKNRKPREWWKEEFCEELARKNKKKRGLKSNSFSNGGELWWQKDEEMAAKRKKRKSRSSIDWWLDGLSGELRSGRRNSQDLASGDIPKSGGISSTPSMRGTVCYIAPEYGGGGQLSEKCDVYSFGVLLLVLISGRRPLQVTASPMSEFERANLISWARQLAHNGKLLDLVDPSIQSLEREQALLCITIALLCLQRSPSKRPSMKEIVGMLSGESEPPHLPFEFSPSPPSNLGFKSRKKPR